MLQAKRAWFIKNSVRMFKTTTLLLLTFFVTFGPNLANAQQESKEGLLSLDDVWAISVGFGEIPFLAGSFKPSVSVGYHLNNYIYFGGTVQLHDVIHRGTESFNATGSGLDGLSSTKEFTGVRVFLGARFRPHRYLPYLSVGGVFNGSDTETMRFAAQSRQLGGQTHDGELLVEVSRPFGIRPAFGLGYSLTLSNRMTFNVDFTGAWLFDAAEPEIYINSSQSLSEAIILDVRERLKKSYNDNFHNRYHLFNISFGYVW